MAPIHQLCDKLGMAFKRNVQRIAVSDCNTHRSIINILYREGMINSYAVGDTLGPFQLGKPVPITPENIAKRKIWVDLKYRNGEPVLKTFKPVSLPSRKIYASVDDLKAIAGARNAGRLLKAQVLGQVTILETQYGILELKEAINKNVGGKVLCYAY